MVIYMASGNPEDFADWPTQETNLSKAKLTSYDTFQEVMNQTKPREQHVIVKDERLGAFLSMEDFERKWKLNETSKDK